ncbi:MAG: P-II family nitrogen regulator, partial [Nitrosopumilus sp.]
MKRVEAIVQSDMAKQVVQAIRDEGVEGITLIQSFGQGQGERPLIGGKQIEFNTTCLLYTSPSPRDS